jgi:hypothetical protein
MTAMVRILIAAALLAACTQPHSAVCKTVCNREAECVASTNSSIPFDEKECVAACSVLESDQDNKAKVQKHAECVAKNEHSCSAVLDCQ